MERTHICGGCGSREDVGYLVDATIAALQKEIATRDSTDSILATRIRELEARLTQRTAELEAAKREVDVWKEKAELRGKEACAQRAELERVKKELAEERAMMLLTNEVLIPSLKHRQGMEG